MEIDKVILEFRIKSIPKDEYTAIGYPIGSTVSCTLEQYRNGKNYFSLNFGQGDGATFNKEELEVLKATVIYHEVITDAKTIEDNFLK